MSIENGNKEEQNEELPEASDIEMDADEKKQLLGSENEELESNKMESEKTSLNKVIIK